MKTKILLLFVFVSTIAQAKTDIDSLKRAAFQPVMNEFIHKVATLSEKIKSTNDADSIKLFAKQLMRISDEMQGTVNRYYSYRGVQTNYALVLTNPPAYALIMTNPGRCPDATISVSKVWDGASNIKYFFSKNPEKIKKNLVKIDTAIKELTDV